MAVSFGLYRTGTELRGSNPSGGSGLASWPTDFTYAGAFRVPSTDSNGAEIWASQGLIGLSATPNNMYISMHTTRTNGGVVEITIPTLSTSTTVTDLSIATVAQDMIEVLNTPDGNPDQNDRISGMYVHDNKLIVTLTQFYDTAADNTLMATVIDGIDDFSTATLSNQIATQDYYRSAGWISDVPADLQAALGFAHIMGCSNNQAGTARASVGPSAYGVNLSDFTTDPAPSFVNATPFQSYSLTNQMQHNIDPTWDLYNSTGANDIWTYNSKTAIGFIVPNTRTYAVFGSIAGLSDMVGYKITQQGQPEACGGYCPYTRSDWSFMRWFFDLDDWIAVKNGEKQAHEIVPYEYGPIALPFEYDRPRDAEENGLAMRGGAFDAANGRVYLSVEHIEQRGTYEKLPVVYAFDVGGV